MNLNSIANYLELMGAGKKGETIFIGEMPFEAKRGALLMDSYAGTRIDHELPGWRDTGFRIAMRSADYEDGFALAQQVSAILTIQRQVEMPPITMRQCLPVNDPLPYRRSKGSGIWEFEVDFECIYIST